MTGGNAKFNIGLTFVTTLSKIGTGIKNQPRTQFEALDNLSKQYKLANSFVTCSSKNHPYPALRQKKFQFQLTMRPSRVSN
jgi:ribosomal protein L44E